ncbi:MAG: ribonuclease III [Anaerolineales bacterium]|nr:ribonuclease III [Anaerolineales bacterium]MCS7247203.1 ribonuclease III [Anaerolineales bacterium]MDW8161014.1 ribonuclease III [Anaerolineales bacterium]MDW8446418.1 ribonuclease III [Anaerolineales bacterium]
MKHNLPIKDEYLLQRALTHRSYLNEHDEVIEDNERLEFLGDAVLDFFVAEWIYHHFPEMSEGDLTKLRSALVKTEQLAEFAKQLGLGQMMRLGKGEEESGGRERANLLCATFEAVVGAIYLDGGMDTVQQFLRPIVQKAAEDIIAQNKEKEPKSILQEWSQSNGYGPPVYRTVSVRGPEHAKIFEVEVYIGNRCYGKGEGPNKRIASKNAARSALKTLNLDQ